MKNIGIVTVYYTENCGSVLQAKCLSDILEGKGCGVYFVKTRNKYSGHSIKRLVKDCLVDVAHFNNPFQSIIKYISYKRFIKHNFREIDNRKIESLNAVIFGSDTVWDIESGYFKESESTFFGKNIPDNISKVAYAVSVANTSQTSIRKRSDLVRQICSFDYLSSRDEHTRDILERVCSKHITKTCDPTLLFGAEHYRRLLPKKQRTSRKNKKYLLLYLFDIPSAAIREQLITFANKMNLEIVSLNGIGKKNNFAHRNINATIENFIAYYDDAEYICTNTFHGTIFSIIFNKQFVVLDYGKNKIREILADFDLGYRMTVNNIEEVFENEIDYDRINDRAAQMAKEANFYISEAIK